MGFHLIQHDRIIPLNESPSEKEGKLAVLNAFLVQIVTLNESPSEKEGKY